MLMVLIMDPENKMFYQQVKYREQIHLTDFHLSAILKKKINGLWKLKNLVNHHLVP